MSAVFNIVIKSLCFQVNIFTYILFLMIICRISGSYPQTKKSVLMKIQNYAAFSKNMQRYSSGRLLMNW